MTRFLSIIYLLFALNQIVVGQNHLLPTKDIFNTLPVEFEYYKEVRTILCGNMEVKPAIQVVILPAFSKEIVFQIFETFDEGIYEAFIKTPTESIWSSRFMFKEHAQTIELEYSKVELNSAVFESLFQLYQAAIYSVRYERPGRNRREDGTSYYFSIWEEGLKTGRTYSPEKGSKMGRLVEITNQLIELMESSKSAMQPDPKLIREIKVLTKEIE